MIEERRSKLASHKKAYDEADSEHERFEAMVNSLSGSFSNLDFLDRKNRSVPVSPESPADSDRSQAPPAAVAKSSLTVSASNQSGAVAANSKFSMQLGVVGNSGLELSSLSYRPSFCDRTSVSGVFTSTIVSFIASYLSRCIYK